MFPPLPCFNPLHCGAVVASYRYYSCCFHHLCVSIPFIAGQWSLPVVVFVANFAFREQFQSPSLRGSGRFPDNAASHQAKGGKFQSPSLRGSGRFVDNALPGFVGYFVSIPFIAGQWSLQNDVGIIGGVNFTRFNPLHCGAVVASFIYKRRGGFFSFMFQSPSLRGSGRFEDSGSTTWFYRSYVSIPFIAGQWSLQCSRRSNFRIFPFCFNPLHCGAVVASPSHNALPVLPRPAAEYAT